MKIQIVPPSPTPPSRTLGDLKPGDVFYRKSNAALDSALHHKKVYLFIYNTRVANLSTNAIVDLPQDSEVVLLNATLNISEPNHENL